MFSEKVRTPGEPVIDAECEFKGGMNMKISKIKGKQNKKHGNLISRKLYNF